MGLSFFNSYFEILAGLNLGYAAFNYFRTELATKVFKINRTSEEFDNLKSRLDIQLSEEQDTPYFIKLFKINQKVEVKRKTLDLKEVKKRYFFEVLKPISFMLSLLCITYLIIAGFQDGADVLNKQLYSNYFFYLTCFTAVFSFTLFYCTFSDRVVDFELKITLSQIIFSFFLFCTLSCTTIYGYFFETIISRLIVLLVFPILLYIVLTMFNLFNVEKYKKRKFWNNCSCFFSLCIDNFKPVILFLLILILGFSPVIYFYYNTEIIFIQYFIVLMTPLFLFAFIGVRVYIHTREFSKEYQKLSDEQTIILNAILD
jgi:hypothetical protein